MNVSGEFTVVGATFTEEVFVDALGLEFEEGDAITDCSNFSSTGGAIFFDDSEGVLKKCEDNVLSTLNTTGGSPDTADIGDVDVTQTELEELETIGATTISEAQWTGLGGASAAGIALWDDADNVAQLVTLGVTATASEINTPLDGASVTLTEFQELETIGATVIEAADWTAVAAMSGINSGDDDTPQAGAVTEAMMASVDFGSFTCGGSATDCDLNTQVVDSDNIVEGTIDMNDISGSINFVTTGTITGNINVILDATTTDAPTGADLRGSMLVYSNAGVVTITLPDVDTVGLGASACFYDSDTTAILTIEIDDDDKILLDDALLAAGQTIDSPGDLGDFICVVAIDVDTTWATMGRRGLWIDGGAT
jgi:hypothetical protein